MAELINVDTWDPSGKENRDLIKKFCDDAEREFEQEPEEIKQLVAAGRITEAIELKMQLMRGVTDG